jgi:hypothetical protein
MKSLTRQQARSGIDSNIPGMVAPLVYPFDEGCLLYYPMIDRLLALNCTGKTVWALLREGCGEGEIASAFACRFGISEDMVLLDIRQLLNELEEASSLNAVEAQAAVSWVDWKDVTGAADKDFAEFEDCGTFLFGDNHFTVMSAVSAVNGEFMSRFRHRVVRDGGCADILQVGKGPSGHRLTVQGTLFEETTTIQRMLSSLVRLLLTLEHPSKPLLAYCHAAAVSCGGRSLIMPGGSGVGKSTLTGFLVANGFAYLGDDICGIAEEDAALLPLPSCLSIKSGSWPILGHLYPVLTRLPTLSRNGRVLRYVEPQQNYETMTSAPAPSAIVFPAYQAGEPTQVSALQPLQTMIRLVGAHAALVAPATEAKLSKLVQFVEQTPAYELTYSELPSALKAIEDLLAAQPQQ